MKSSIIKYGALIFLAAYLHCKPLELVDLVILHADSNSLKSTTKGDCLDAKTSGLYTVGVALDRLNTIELHSVAIKSDSFQISSDTLNGMYFYTKGKFQTPGDQIVLILGHGIPQTKNTTIFHFTLSGSRCSLPVNVQDAVQNPLGEYALIQNGSSCLDYHVFGNYQAGHALDTSHRITFKLDVLKTGAYDISTSVSNGIKFSSGGFFTKTGIQLVTLNGSGAPINNETTNLVINGKTSICSIIIDVLPVSIFNYFPLTTNSYWSYEYDDKANDTALFYSIQPGLSIKTKTYNIVMVSRGLTTDTAGYYVRSGSDYIRYLDMGDFIGLDLPLWSDYIFLKDAPEGTNWKSEALNGTYTIRPFPPTPLTFRFSSTVTAKDINMTLETSTGSKVYSNVIIIEEKYERFEAGRWNEISPLVGSLRKYYARNIGMIKYEAINGAGNITTTLKLRRYKIY